MTYKKMIDAAEMGKIDLLHGDCLDLMKDIPEEIKRSK